MKWNNALLSLAILFLLLVAFLIWKQLDGQWLSFLAAFVCLLFGNLDRIESFKASPTGVEARTREVIPVEARAQAVDTTLSEASAKGFQISEDIRAKVENLSQLVEQLATSQDQTAEQLAVVAANAKQIETSLSASAGEIAQASAVVQRAKFPVGIGNFEDASVLEKQLKNAGFSPYIYEAGGGIEDRSQHSTIWIGSSVPKEVAAAVLDIAVRYYPFLKYVALDEEVSDNASEIYIGADTTWGKSNGRELSRTMLLQLSDAKSQEDFHKLIRKTGE